MNRPDIKNSKYYSGHIFLDQKYMDDQNIYIDQLEEENKQLSEDIKYIGKQNIDVHNEIKPWIDKCESLSKALKAIQKVTDDEDLPLFKVIHQIAFKTLKL